MTWIFYYYYSQLTRLYWKLHRYFMKHGGASLLLRMKKIWLKCDELSKLCHGHGLKNLIYSKQQILSSFSVLNRKRNQGCVIAVINCFANRYLGVYLSMDVSIDGRRTLFHFFLYLKPVEISKKCFNTIWTSLKVV